MRFFIALILLCSLSSKTFAQSTGRVGGARVQSNLLDIEGRTVFVLDDENASQDNRFRSRLHIDYGFNDFYAIRLTLNGDRRDGDSYEHESAFLEARLHHLTRAEHGFDFGTRWGFTLKDGDKTPHSFDFGFFEEFDTFEGQELWLNQLFSIDSGEDAAAGFRFEFRARYLFNINEKHQFGVDSFNNFGNTRTLSGYSDQNHSVGPMFTGHLPYNMRYEASILNGVSRGAADQTFKLFIRRFF